MNKKSSFPVKEAIYLNCKCGEQIEVIFIRQPGANEKEEFNCPGCKREHSFKSSIPIKVEGIQLYKR